MDAVITYVDGLDELWQEDYRKATNAPFIVKRYRDWGTLKYLLRGIENHMPFIDKVYLVVARDSQVPSWVDRSKLNIVLHKDIIPQEYLPTFNSTAIEMFLHRIPGLKEKYLYFNDDIFPILPCSEEDFEINGKSAMGFSKNLLALSLFKKQTRNADRLAQRALGLKPGISFIRPQHCCTTMIKSDCEELFNKMQAEILSTVTPLRETQNLSQYVYLDYSYHKGNIVPRRISNKHISLAVYSGEKISRYLANPGRKFVCINDVHLKDEEFKKCRDIILNAFEKLFPSRSKFEIHDED